MDLDRYLARIGHDGRVAPDLASFLPDFDFTETPDQARLTRSCAQLLDDPTSLFRQNLLVMRPTTAGTHVLLGRVYKAPGEQSASSPTATS